jgi:hypothetical protein
LTQPPSERITFCHLLSPSVGFCHLLTPKKGFFLSNYNPINHDKRLAARESATEGASNFLKLYQTS